MFDSLSPKVSYKSNCKINDIRPFKIEWSDRMENKWTSKMKSKMYLEPDTVLRLVKTEIFVRC